jgi:putative ABC transport system ATP-binding protein
VATEPIIEVQNLTKVYHMGGVDVPALRGVSLTASRGEFVAILGASGSGKSTLLHVIGGLTPPSGGHVKIGGKDLAKMTDSDRTDLRKRTVGFVFQRFNLLPTLTAEENIAIARHIAGNKTTHDAEFDNLVRILGIQHRLGHKPYALSGGEQQRVAIARAIVNHPAILLADEPTGNLDSRSGAEVLQTFEDLHRAGHTIILVTHDANVAARAERIVEMSDGRVVVAQPA